MNCVICNTKLGELYSTIPLVKHDGTRIEAPVCNITYAFHKRLHQDGVISVLLFEDHVAELKFKADHFSEWKELCSGRLVLKLSEMPP